MDEENVSSHFYVGHFPDKATLLEFVEESEDYYSDEEDGHYEDDEEIPEEDTEEKYISAFAKSQGEHRLDLDFMESGFSEKPGSFAEKFPSASYLEAWIDEFQRRFDALENKGELNTLIIIGKEQIAHPVSVKTDAFHLVYVGEIEYTI